MRADLIVRVPLLLSILSSAASAADWPRWRGPRFDGISPETGVFSGGVGLDLVWKRTLGSGYAGIAVVDDRLVTAFSEGTHDVVVALDADRGTELWRYEIGPTHRGHNGAEDGPLGTPTVAGGEVFVLGPEGDLFALGLADGRELWRIRIGQAVGARAPEHGFASVPLVTSGVVVVQTGGPSGRSICGFGRRTGRVLWCRDDDTVGYQSPVLATLNGVEQVIAAGNHDVLGLLPVSGEVLWKHRYRDAERVVDLVEHPGDGRVVVRPPPQASHRARARILVEEGPTRQHLDSRRVVGEQPRDGVHGSSSEPLPLAADAG